MSTTIITLQQKASDAAAAPATAACDSLKTADLHHRFTQDIRKQIEVEYNAAVDDEIAAAGASGGMRKSLRPATSAFAARRSAAWSRPRVAQRASSDF
jgi:hypothetical protein